jgi:hypothetical protein
VRFHIDPYKGEGGRKMEAETEVLLYVSRKSGSHLKASGLEREIVIRMTS